MSRPLWDRGQPIDQVLLRFTTGRDPELDVRLAPHDALASAAHASMLARISSSHQHGSGSLQLGAS